MNKKGCNKMIKYMFSLAIIFSGSLCAAQIQGNVIRVLDGDTLEILQDKNCQGPPGKY